MKKSKVLYWRNNKVIFILSFLFFGCSFNSEYSNLLSRELSSGKINNQLFLGFQFGDSKDDYFDICTELNKKKIITSGGRNFSPEQILIPIEENGKKIKMSFFGLFDNDRILNGMDIRFNFLGWSIWNKEYHSDNLIHQVKDSILRWFPGNDFIDYQLEDISKNAYVKLDGNRRIIVYILDNKDVAVKINDLNNQ